VKNFKKLAWRFTRGAVYIFLSGLAAKYGPAIGVNETAAASAIGGILLAADKALGVGGLVSGEPTK